MRSLLIAICAAALAGCYSKSHLRQEWDQGYATARAECVSEDREVLEYINSLHLEIRQKNKRLAKLNQIDADGNLRGEVE